MRAAVLALPFTLCALGGIARADAIKLQMFTRVAEGERPKVRITATAPLDSIEVELQRDDGKTITARFGRLARGASKDVVLDGDPGTHRWSGRITVTRGGDSSENPLSLETVVAARLEVRVDKSRVDVKARRLEVTMSRPAGFVDIEVFGATGGGPLARERHDFGGKAAGQTLVVTWPPFATETDVARIDLRVEDKDGFFQTLSLYPWAVHIPHEEVTFATDSAAIAATETPKLEASHRKVTEALARHGNIGPIKLFIAGHSDTVGAAAYNLKLSQRRAQAIAGWFRKRGLSIPIFYEGFGEHAPVVATPDEKDEPRNRRVDYILAVEEPALKTVGFRGAWKRVP